MIDLVLESNSYLDKLDEIQLKYNIFLAENEMNKKMIQLGSNVVLENNMSLYSINESVKDWIITFATRISEALQKAWTKFKTLFAEGKDLAYLRAIKNKVEGMAQDPNFNITANLREYNKDALKNFSIKEFDYATMKDSLDSEKHFLSVNYNNLGFTDEKSNVKEVCNEYFVKTRTDSVACTVDMIKEYFNWCYKEYIDELNKIEDNMKKYNTSNKNIESFCNTTLNQTNDTNNNQNTTDVNAACTMYGECIIREKVGDQMTFQDTGENPNNKDSTTGNNLSDNVKVFLTATTSLLSTIFIIVKNQKADYIRILKHCFPMGKNKDDSDIAKDNEEQNNTSAIPEVK